MDLPAPLGPTNKVDSCGTSTRLPSRASLRPSGRPSSSSGISSVAPLDGPVTTCGGFVWAASARAKESSNVVSRCDRRAEIGEPDVTVDEEIHRSVDVAESVRGLVELSEVHLFHIIEGCDDDIGNYDGYLAIELIERDQKRPHLDDATDGLEDFSNTVAARAISRSSPLSRAICSLYSRMRARSKRKFASTVC